MDSKQFDEDWLQHLLFENPQLLALNRLAPHFGHPVALARELSVTAGAIDLLYASTHGNLCIVETKLWRNPEAHRTVLAQILDYAKDLSRMSYTDFRSKLETSTARRGRTQDLLQRMAQASANAFDSISFEENVRRTLRTGSFELFIVGDRIRPEVALLSEILGSAANLEFSLHLMEIGFYRLNDGEDWPLLAVPTLVGKTHEVTRGVVKIRYEGMGRLVLRSSQY